MQEVNIDETYESVRDLPKETKVDVSKLKTPINLSIIICFTLQFSMYDIIRKNITRLKRLLFLSLSLPNNLGKVELFNFFSNYLFIVFSYLIELYNIIIV